MLEDYLWQRSTLVSRLFASFLNLHAFFVRLALVVIAATGTDAFALALPVNDIADIDELFHEFVEEVLLINGHACKNRKLGNQTNLAEGHNLH